MFSTFITAAIARGRFLPHRRIRATAGDGTVLFAGLFERGPAGPGGRQAPASNWITCKKSRGGALRPGSCCRPPRAPQQGHRQSGSSRTVVHSKRMASPTAPASRALKVSGGSPSCQ